MSSKATRCDTGAYGEKVKCDERTGQAESCPWLFPIARRTRKSTQRKERAPQDDSMASIAAMAVTPTCQRGASEVPSKEGQLTSPGRREER
jgi:hypothetical protein